MGKKEKHKPTKSTKREVKTKPKIAQGKVGGIDEVNEEKEEVEEERSLLSDELKAELGKQDRLEGRIWKNNL